MYIETVVPPCSAHLPLVLKVGGLVPAHWCTGSTSSRAVELRKLLHLFFA